ncbi:MAG TPA: hypothetical protein PLQ06_13995 [Bacteroidales bacterium]|nr:hypothetical protein [Bacteroidales bacterium]
MRNKITIDGPDVVNSQVIRTPEPKTVPLPGVAEKRPASDIIAAEGSDDFAHYVEWLGFSKDPDMLVLSSTHHYYYDAGEMKNIKTVVNLIELNQIKDLPDFISSMFGLLPSKSFFIASFADKRKKKSSQSGMPPATVTLKESEDIGNGISSGIPFIKSLFSLLDSKINRKLTAAEVTQILSDNGFRILDMTELNGKNYFCAQKILKVIK